MGWKKNTISVGGTGQGVRSGACRTLCRAGWNRWPSWRLEETVITETGRSHFHFSECPQDPFPRAGMQIQTPKLPGRSWLPRTSKDESQGSQVLLPLRRCLCGHAGLSWVHKCSESCCLLVVSTGKSSARCPLLGVCWFTLAQGLFFQGSCGGLGPLASLCPGKQRKASSALRQF